MARRFGTPAGMNSKKFLRDTLTLEVEMTRQLLPPFFKADFPIVIGVDFIKKLVEFCI